MIYHTSIHLYLKKYNIRAAMLIYFYTFIRQYLQYICTMAKGVKGSSPAADKKAIRTSFIIDPVLMKKIRYIALMEEHDITTVVNGALIKMIVEYERKIGVIPIK